MLLAYQQLGLFKGASSLRLLFLLLCLFFFASSSVRADVHLIVHADVPLAKVSQNTARRIFIQHYKRWPDGHRVRVFVFADRHPIHVEMTKKLLGLYPTKLRKLIQRQVFTGTGQAPTEVGSVQEMQERVMATPGGIGYLREDALHEQIKILEVQ